MMLVRNETEEEKRLNGEKRARIAAALKADPNRSDRVIARETQTSQPTTYRVRKQLQEAGEIPIVNPLARKIGAAGDRESYSAKIRAAIGAELKQDPNRSDRVIAIVTNTASNTVWAVRRELEAAGEIKPVKVSERRTTGGHIGMDRGAGSKINVPDGYSVSEYIATGLQREKDDGLTIETAAKALKVSTKAYSQVRTLLILSRNQDLTRGDAMIVADALEKVNKDKFVGRHWKEIEPLVQKIWGADAARSKNEGALKKRKKAFKNALALTWNTCAAAGDIEVPLLSEAERDEAYQSLTEAISYLTHLRGKVRRGL